MVRRRKPAEAEPPTSFLLRLAVALALLALLALILVMLLRPHEPEKRAAPPRPRPEPTTPRVSYGPAPPRAPTPSPAVRIPPSPTPEPAPVIDEITIEKKEVCAGEENLVTVRAHTVNNTDPWLHYMIGSDIGQQVPVKAVLDNGQPVRQQILVFGRGGSVTSAQVPEFVVKDCKVLRTVLVSFQVVPNTWGQYEFWAKVADVDAANHPDAPPFVPSSYEWDFGDGSKETTHGPIIQHDYETRMQDSMVSEYLVRVEVQAEDGQKLVGRRSLQLLNSAFEDFQDKGLVMLMTAMTPRFPVLNDRGVVEQRVHIWHYRPDPVRITEIKVMRYYEGSGDSAPLEMGNIGQLLGTNTIPPGSGIEVPFSFDTNENKKMSHVTYWLEGFSAEGLPVRGNVSIMRPTGKPTKQDNEPVMDPGLKARIVAARQILGQDYVTDDDLFRLEREGAFKDLPPRGLAWAPASDSARTAVPQSLTAPPPPEPPPVEPSPAPEGSGPTQ